MKNEESLNISSSSNMINYVKMNPNPKSDEKIKNRDMPLQLSIEANVVNSLKNSLNESKNELKNDSFIDKEIKENLSIQSIDSNFGRFRLILIVELL